MTGEFPSTESAGSLFATEVVSGLYVIEGAYEERLDPFRAWRNLRHGTSQSRPEQSENTPSGERQSGQG
jgi:hypothetical protein